MSRPGFLRRIYPRFADRYMRPRSDADRRVRDAAIATTRRGPGPGGRRRALGQLLLARSTTCAQGAASISSPTLVVWGKRDPVIPLKLGRRAAASIPGAELVVLDTGHSPQVSDPEGFAARLIPFADAAFNGRDERRCAPLALCRCSASRGAVEVDGGIRRVLRAGQRARRSSSATAGSPTPTSGARSSSELAGEFRCLALDLPLGSHRTPMDADADLGPLGVAALIAGVVERLDLEDVTLVGNDSGGAYSQIALTRHGERLADRVSRPRPHLLRDALRRVAAAALRRPARGGGRPGRPRPAARRPRGPRDPRHAARLRPAAQAPGRARGLRLLRAAGLAATPASSATSPRRWPPPRPAPVRAAGEGADRRLSELPTLLIWSERGRGLPARPRRALCRGALQHGELVAIDDSFSFTPEDQPRRGRRGDQAASRA